MTWLTTTELTSLRAHMTETLPDTCKVEYLTETQDARGAIVRTWTARGTAIACRISPFTGTQFPQYTAEMPSERSYRILSVAYDQAVAVTDRVTHGGRVYQAKIVNYGAESEILLTRVLLEAEQ